MRFLLTAILAMAAGPSCASSPPDDDHPPDLNCNIGPLSKTYGQTAWLVYACDDSRSAVVVSDKGNPALPFYFIFYVNPQGDMRLYGEGTGKKSATQAAFNDLELLTQGDVAALIKEAQSVQAGGVAK